MSRADDDDDSVPSGSGLDAQDAAVVEAAVEDLAGLAAVVARSECPQCGTSIAAPVDVASFLWARVAREAPAALSDIADLAVAFGWAEADILGLSPARRDAYLGLIRGGQS